MKMRYKSILKEQKDSTKYNRDREGPPKRERELKGAEEAAPVAAKETAAAAAISVYILLIYQCS